MCESSSKDGPAIASILDIALNNFTEVQPPLEYGNTDQPWLSDRLSILAKRMESGTMNSSTSSHISMSRADVVIGSGFGRRVIPVDREIREREPPELTQHAGTY
uniref:Uncharacterized protein n=1 Tax=Coccidioides posadasii RMSCC 3488 TaxID=454284 RepID=A0A0J6I4F0_COCPO|nr:hypothetical protein CPAG_02587 [Coccidioides posadasii RMSCC 3488]